jgi:Rrf2 family protein
MHISSKGNYGLRAILELAMRYGQGHVQTAEIADRQQIPESYLVQLLNQMRKAGLIRSVRGPRGGHSLVQNPDEVTVGRVLDVLEGPIDLVGEDAERGKGSQSAGLLREVWDDVKAAIDDVVQSVTLGDLCRKQQMRETAVLYRI